MNTSEARGQSPTVEGAAEMVSTRIVVADHGWVFVGKVTERPNGDVVINNARVIRRWGTTGGLGQLVDGPLQATKLDPAGTVVIPAGAVVFTILCTRDW